MPHEDDPSVELAFDRAGVALSVTDTAGHLLHSNRAFGELFGWTEDDGADISVITRPEDREWTQTYISRIVRHTNGCSSSIVSALDAIDPGAAGLLLFLGDQPGVPSAAVDSLLDAAAAGAEVAVVEYNDGTGHPFWFARSMFGPLADLHGDKAVWKLLESGQFETSRVRVDAEIPLDVDTWEDYQELLAND